MATAETDSYLELFDVSKKARIGKRPLSQIRFIPRIGERIFLSPEGAGSWTAYNVVMVEYFLGYDASSGEPIAPIEGMGRVTIYLEGSK
jgi:hypothetical protein